MQSSRLLLLVGLLAACSDEVAPPDGAVSAPVQPLPANVVRAVDGRAHYIVALDRGALGAMPRSAVRDARFAAHHDAAAVHLVHAFEQQYRIEASQMTSLVGLTFAAYLTPDQAAVIAWDPRVKAVELDHVLTFSSDATSVWQDGTGTGVGSEHVAWGTTAVGSGASALRVYVLDTGVTPNATELNLVQRVNSFCPHGEVNMYCPTGAPVLVGCYRHSTHVAGIVGAIANTTGSRGVAAGVPISSVSILDPRDVDGACIDAQEGPTDYGLQQGLEFVKSDLMARGAIGVVNISINGPEFVSGLTHDAIVDVIAPGPGYLGTFIAESGGNDYSDACAVSYPAHSSGDGVMVVGMINDHGQAVRPLNGLPGERNGSLAASEPGSNYGPCIEAWAPGRSIFSTWSGGYQYLSGTSMASPHVAGLAARLGGATPAAIEANVRSHLMALGSYAVWTDPVTHAAMSQAISMPTTSPLGAGAHNTPYAEVVASATSTPPSTTVPEDGYRTYTDKAFSLSFDSSGTSPYSCDLYRKLGTGTPILVGNGTKFSVAVAANAWAAGVWTVYSNSCPSAKTTVTLDARAVSHWYVDNVDKTNQLLSLPADSTSVLRYTSTNASSCDLTIYDMTGFQTALPGYPHVNNGTAATVPLQTTVGKKYLYQVQCHDTSPTSAFSGVTITVTAAQTLTNGATFVSQTGVPASVVAGSTFSATLTFKNSGTTTWTPGGNYHLGSANPQNNTTWGTSRLNLAAGDSIAPNANKAWTSTFTAPATAGTYAFQWQVQQDATGYFGGASTNASITVTSSGGGGVCTPGDTQACCPCSPGNCNCGGDQTCNAQGQWGGCRGYACKPAQCP